jgi:peptide/nickel transport system substrate-binding protein
VALALAAAACGSDDDDDTSSSGTSAPAGSAGAASTAAPDESTAAAPGQSAAEDTGTPKQGGEITWMVFVAMASLDPKMNDPGGVCCDAGQIYGVYDSLIRVAADGTITPRLAQSVTPNEDFTTWTIELRPDLHFTDDTPLDATAVQVNMERHKDPNVGSRCIVQASQIASTTVESPTTLSVKLAGPNSQFPILLQGCLGLIASPTALEKYGDQYGSTPDKTVGAGPFTVETFNASSDSVLVRNPDFWDAPRPYLDRIRIVSAAANPQAAADALQSDQAQLATFMVPHPAMNTLEAAGYEPIWSEFFGGQGWGFNTLRPPLDDARVRRALTISLDPDVLNEQVFAGAGQRGDTFFPKDSPYYDPSLTYPEYDMAEAQRLIDEYIAEKGGTVDLKMTANEQMSPMGVYAKQQFDQLEGVNFEIDVLTSAGVGDAYFSRSYDVGAQVLSGVTGYPYLHDVFTKDSPVNFTGFTNPDIDAALARVLTTDDPKVIAESYQAIARVVLDELPYAVLWPSLSKTYKNDELHGVELFRSHNVDLTLLYLD